MENRCPEIQRELDRPKSWAEGSLLKFNKGKGKVLHLQRSNPRHQCMLGAVQLENNFSEKELRILVNKLNMSQQCALDTKKSSSILSSIRQNITSTSRTLFLPVLLSANKTHQECWVLFQSPQYKKGTDLSKSSKQQQR
ncbi:hypothetical protein llap_1720 [Limosa lapponica baueri]|uniref:Rna-directed dna polymerase from mobile element jockey-like n=1 Tax=Limosa lapponica baueri TaxID=1758121 RepID=A0A2I0UPQ0_LIMLA|nr:hypothetical protein llap_1720 [Limosa lapponica baueri]